MKLNKYTRRRFLGTAGCAAMGSTTMMSSVANLILSSKLLATQNTPLTGYKALVCLLLQGGNDSYNMLIPRGNPEYADYLATRADLALEQNTLLPINPITSDGKEYGLHPSMGGMQTLFENGNLALLSNVGTLIEPIANEAEYDSGLKQIPLGLFSHSDQQQQWQTALPQSREAIGWGGKMADILKTLNTNQGISMNISLDGRNIWQSGNTVLEYSISNEGDGVEGIEPYQPWKSNSGFLNMIREDAIKDMATQMYANVFKETIGSATNDTMESFQVFKNAIQGVTPFATNFSTTNLSQDLHMIAKTIAAKDALGMCRQTFFVSIGGWDNHDELINTQANNLGVVSNAISEFYAALEEIGMQNDVTLFSASDFARTLTSNGQGSDHAWGGNVFICGGAVTGQEMYGTFPELYLDGNPLVINSRGNLIPSTSTDAYFAELAMWFGIAKSDLPLILPNISNFYDINSSSNPIGFLP